mmetsp:Transcript_19058/g.26620  ORF Transcript_19058/g.26620 Transcript_19058/m.26620 type:complete len:111 (-) Transcript_19058:372-704(-)
MGGQIPKKHEKIVSPPGKVYTLRSMYKGRDGAVLKRGTLVTEFPGHTFGVAPFNCVPITRLMYDFEQEKWVTSKTFVSVHRSILQPVENEIPLKNVKKARLLPARKRNSH